MLMNKEQLRLYMEELDDDAIIIIDVPDRITADHKDWIVKGTARVSWSGAVYGQKHRLAAEQELLSEPDQYIHAIEWSDIVITDCEPDD